MSFQSAQDRAAALEAEMAGVQGELEKASVGNTVLGSAVQTLTADVDASQTSVSDLESQLLEADSALDTANARVAELETELGSVEGELQCRAIPSWRTRNRSRQPARGTG